MDSQMKRGILEMCVLYQFLSQDYYGYDIMARMKSFFPEVNDSTFYVILRRLNADGYTKNYYGMESNGPQRKYYTITEKGREHLQHSIEDWVQLKDIVKEIGIDL